MKDKVSLEDTFVAKESAAYMESLSGLTESKNEAVEALTALGYSATEALRAVKKVENAESMDVGELLKAALNRFIGRA